jgi:hypothetical protein
LPDFPTSRVLLAFAVLACAAPALGQDEPPPATESSPPASIPGTTPEAHAEPDNGTDPTRIRRQATMLFQHFDLRQGFTSDTLELIYVQPLGGHTSLSATVPFPSVDTAGDDSFGFGDFELELTHIPVVTRHYGIVLKADVTFDTASRPELGNGQTVLQGTFIFARFLRGGAIFAPSFEARYGVDRDPGRTRVNSLTVDFYYVPRLANRNYYMTVDPFLAFDWERDTQSGGLTMTLGRVIGPAFGGRLQAYVKPGVFVGSDRSSNWGIEVGIKLLGF